MFKGVVLSITSSALFALLYYYAVLLAPMNGEEIFGWRMLLMWPCISAFLILNGEWRQVMSIWQRITERPPLIVMLCLSSALLGIQQWLFMWAPLNGRALDVSLGYFLLPMVMLLAGRYVYGERLTRLQKMAALCAALGVANELIQLGRISWTTLLVAFGFTGYFILRRRIATAHLGGLWFDISLTFPVAIYFAIGHGSMTEDFPQTPRLYFLLPLLAVISAGAFMSYTVASKLLPFSLFGLLGYFEPVLMVAVALLLGEKIRTEQWMTYLPIWTAVALVIADGSRHIWRTRLSSSRQRTETILAI